MERDRRYRARLGDELRISVKMLLAQLGEGHNSIDDNSPQLERFCLVLEKAFLHGLQESMWGRTKYYWDFIQNLTKVHPPGANSIENVMALSQVRTPAGRGRAWIRFALIEKKLEKYVRILVSKPDLLAKWYEPYALFRVKEDCDVYLGFLAPLAMVDFSICLKDIDFDNLPTDLSLYPVESLNQTVPTVPEEAVSIQQPQQQQPPPQPVTSAATDSTTAVVTGEEVTVRSRKDRERDKEKRARKEERNKWQGLLESKEAEWKQLASSLEEALAQKEASLQEQATKLRALSSLEDEIRELREHEQMAKHNISSLHSQLHEAEERLKNKADLGQDLVAEKERLTQERLLLEAELHQLKEEARIRESRLNEQAEELAKLIGARDALQQRLNETDESMWHRVQQMSIETDQERNRLAAIEVELERSRAENKATTEELRRTKEELATVVARLRKVDGELAGATDGKRNSEIEAEALRNERDQVLASFKAQETELVRLKDEIASLMTERDQALQSMKTAETDASTLRSALKDNQEKQLKSEMECTDLKEKFARMQDNIRTQETEAKRLEEELKDTRREKDKLSRELDSVRRERELEGMGKDEIEGALKREVNDLHQRLESLIGQEEQYKERLERQHQHENELRESFEMERQQMKKEHEEKLALLQNRVKVKDMMVEKKTRELEDALKERDEAQERLKLTAHTSQKVEEDNKAIIEQLRDELSESLKRHEQHTAELTAQLRDLEHNLSEEKRRAAEEATSLSSKIEEQQEALRQSQALITSLSESADTSRSLRQELDAAQIRAKEVESDLAKLHDEANTAREEREKLRQERDVLKEEKKKKEKDMDGLMKLLLAKEARIAELQQEAEEAEKSRSAAEEGKSVALDRVRAIETEMNQTSESQAAQQKRNLALLSEMEACVEELRKKNAALQRKLEKRATKIAHLKTIAKTAEGQEQTKALLTDLRQQVNDLMVKTQSYSEARTRAESQLMQYQRENESLKRTLAELDDRCRLAEQEQQRALHESEEQASQIIDLKKTLERKEEIIKDSKQLINDRERRLREFMNRENRDHLKNHGDEAWVVLDDQTQHRLLDDMRSVLAVTKQMVEEKAHEIDGLQEQLQDRDERLKQMQITIDKLQQQLAEKQTHKPVGGDLRLVQALENATAERDALQLRYTQDVTALQGEVTKLQSTVTTLMEQGSVLKRLLALQGDASSGTRSAPASPLARPK